MKEFIVNLYANEYFPIYLGGILLVLIIAFFVVLILGKKDKKNIEKTQKLEQINAAAFNEANISVNPEVTLEPVMQQEYVDDKTQVYPVVTPELNPPQEEIPVYSEPVTQNVEMPVEQTPVVQEQVASVELTSTSPVENVIPIPVVENTEIPVEQASIENENQTLLEEDAQPLLQNFDNLAASISSELDSLQQAQDKYNSLTNQVPMEDTLFDETVQIEMPSLNNDQTTLNTNFQENVEPVIQNPIIEEKTESVVPNATPINNVFSSVYVPPKNDNSFDEEEEIELPRLK